MAMWLFAEAIKTGGELKVFNHGKMRRDFTYVDDIVSGIVASLFVDGLDQYEVFNLGNHKSEELMDMISMIEKEMDGTANKVMYPMQDGDVPETFADIEKAKTKLGYEPTTEIEEGIPKFIQWYKDHDDIANKVIDWRKNS
jgi:UDP-glucuronate 4-epimerase